MSTSTMPECPKPDFEEPVAFLGGAVVLRPWNEGQRAYIIDVADPPLVPKRDGGWKVGPRTYQRKRSTVEDAYEVATRATGELVTKANALVAGGPTALATKLTWGDVYGAYVDEEQHPSWRGGTAGTRLSYVRNHVTADHVLVNPTGTVGVNQRVRLRDLSVTGPLTATQLQQVASYARDRVSPSTFHNGVRLTIRQGAYHAVKLVPELKRAHVLEEMVEVDWGKWVDSGGVVDVENEIPPWENVFALADRMDELWPDERNGTLVRFLASSGPRIGEALALAADSRFSVSDDIVKYEILERVPPEGWPQWRVDASHELPLPKRDKTRTAVVAGWLVPDVVDLLEQVSPGGLLYPSPSGGYFAPNTWRPRRFDVAAQSLFDEDEDLWPMLPDYRDWWERHGCPRSRLLSMDIPNPVVRKRAEAERPQRKWLWPIHHLRHRAATYLNALGLSWDDVAKVLGHESGAELQKMYGHAEAHVYSRIAAATSTKPA